MHGEPSLTHLRRHAVFLDLDGTLADIALVPSLAVVPRSTVEVIARLSLLLDGAVAVVSGRQLDDIDRMLGLHELAAAGVHGVQIRSHDRTIQTNGDHAEEIRALEAALLARLGDDAGLLIERKLFSIAVHYRSAPERHDEIVSLAKDLVVHRPNLKVMTGKRVVEILPALAGKGVAIARFMGQAPFAGRVPLFAGDDVTDEDGFAAVNAMGGISIKIGDGPTTAGFSFASAERFRAWLDQMTSVDPGDADR